MNVLLLLACLASASEVPFRAMKDEMARSLARLRLGKAAPPYFLSYTVLDTESLQMEASFGALKDPHEVRTREIKADLRVGDRRFDQTHYIGKDHWRHRPFTETAPRADDYDALRFALWGLTDKAYKAGLERLAQKRAFSQARNLPQDAPDLSAEPAVPPHREPAAGPNFDLQAWGARLRELSAVFRRFPAVETSAVRLYLSRRSQYFLDSEGRQVLKPSPDFAVIAEAAGHAPDGMAVTDKRRFVGLAESDLKQDELLAWVERLAKDVTALTLAPPAQAYIGPVLLEEEASAELFNQLLARPLSAPRADWVEEDPIKENFLSGDLAERLGLRVLPAFLSVYDDPGLAALHGRPLTGHYRVDDEGVPARRVGLIENGILKDVLMSRAPIKQRERSTGHGRGALSEFALARPGNLVISASKTKTPAELRAELLARAKDYGMPYGLIIRRLALEETQEKDESLARPVLAYKLHPDGREELIRDARFSGVSSRALRDIVAAGEPPFVYNYYQTGPHKNNRELLAASIVAPAVLVAELELRKTDKKPEKKPYLRHPYFTAGRR